MTPEQQPSSLWTVDKAAVQAEIRDRNVLRKTALLPLLDEQKEFEHACRVIRLARWHAFEESKKADYQRFRDELYANGDAPSGFMGMWARHIAINKRFEAFLRANYADEIAMVMEIAPDYIAITRQTVEGPYCDEPADYYARPHRQSGQSGQA